MYINIIHNPRIPFTTLVLKYIFEFSNCDGYYFVANIFYMFKFFNVY